MSHARIAFLLAVGAAFAATGVAAESAMTPGVNTATSPILAAPQAAATAPTSRAISPETAARLATSMPKFVAPASNESAPESGAPAPPVVDTDKPRNTIIRLPEYSVREAKVPAIKERELLTPKARLDLALQRHPGARIGNFFGLNDDLALALLAQEERLEKKREFEDLVSLTRFSDPATHATIKREIERAFMREPDFGR